MEEAADTSNPLLERLRFLTIFSGNLDEFFSIRVSGLQEQLIAGVATRSPDGLTPLEQIRRINDAVEALTARQSQLLHLEILPQLAQHGIHVVKFEQLSDAQKHEARVFFQTKVFPLLTPLALDPAHPVPHLRSLGLNLLVKLKDPAERGEIKQAFVPIPPLLPRFQRFQTGEEYLFVPVEEIIQSCLDLLFPRMQVYQVWRFRITRNADLDIADAEADDLLKLIERELRKRRLGTIQRLEVEEDMGPKTCKFLRDVFELDGYDLYRISGHMALESFSELINELPNHPHLKYPPFTANVPPLLLQADDIFESIRQEDILLHHPYDSFRPVTELIQSAAKDPDVLAIKQTLYRTGGKSKILQALMNAVHNGKQVSVLMELKARFDEQTNITWAKDLERAGANVVYGLIGLKTHCKTTLILRKEGDEIRRYCHLSTGNYNERTANHYTDIGLLTSDPDIGADLTELFNFLTGYSKQDTWRKLLIAPINLRQRLSELVDLCIAHHTPQQPSHICLVMNALVDPDMIEALYRANNAGVRVDLVVRGICCLVPGLKGQSELISVRSIVGRFLEHSRVFAFTYGGQTHLFAGSADWMPRNLNNRIEVIFPVEAENTKSRLLAILERMLQDTCKAWFLQPDGNYVRQKPAKGQKAFNAQQYFLDKTCKGR